MTGKIASFFVAALIWIQSLFGAGSVQLVKPADMPQFQAKDGWELVFSDEFDGDRMDTERWRYGYESEGVRRGGYWVDDAVFVQDGNLVIRTNYRENGKFGAGWYTGTVQTAQQSYDGSSGADGFKGFSATYGYFEARCKLPEIYGAWAAFWLMPDGNFKNDVFGTGEDGSEIDIFESPFMYDKIYKNSVSHAVHIDGYGKELKTLGSKMQYVKSLYDDFHTFALEWNEDEYIFYVDGFETWRTKDKAGTVSKISEYMIFSVEVGGNEIDGVVTPGKEKDPETGEIRDYWTGNLDKNSKDENYDFLIDYVKVYQKK